MTNTATTDVEVLERNFPVLLREFSIRRGSGGAGRHRGGTMACIVSRTASSSYSGRVAQATALCATLSSAATA